MHKNAEIKERIRTNGCTRYERWELSNRVTKCIKHGNILSYEAIIHGLLIDLKESAKKLISIAHAFAPHQSAQIPKHGKNKPTGRKAGKKA